MSFSGSNYPVNVMSTSLTASHTLKLWQLWENVVETKESFHLRFMGAINVYLEFLGLSSLGFIVIFGIHIMLVT